MPNYLPLSYDLAKIEQRAQQLRAQTLASGVKRLISWVNIVIHTHPKGENHAP